MGLHRREWQSRETNRRALCFPIPGGREPNSAELKVLRRGSGIQGEAAPAVERWPSTHPEEPDGSAWELKAFKGGEEEEVEAGKNFPDLLRELLLQRQVELDGHVFLFPRVTSDSVVFCAFGKKKKASQFLGRVVWQRIVGSV